MTMKNIVCDSITACLEGRENTDSIFPFLWVHGESHERLQEEIDAIYNCGIWEFCVESRTHEQFCEEQWWDDFTFILEYAASKNMRVWLLDDKHFPTGYANGAIEKKYPHLRRKRIRIAFVDVAGPVEDAGIMLPPMDCDETVLSVISYLRTGIDEDVDGESGIILTEKLQDNLLFWNVPKGVWRIFYIIRTERGPGHFRNYIDMCDADSCKVMLTEIYEPHYAHYKKFFGNTFRGFFSDEPCFGNTMGGFSIDTLGTPSLVLSWRADMIQLIAKKMNISENEAELQIPGLWFNVTNKTASIRLAYMDIVTQLYRDNFSTMLGDWCKERNVMYIGHVNESTRARFGFGSGHFFRSMEGQDMAGMDVVLNCIRPGIVSMSHSCTASVGVVRNPDFNHYTLGRMAASSARLDSKKQGRVMCEIFGAFGWAEGLPMMKYLTDLMMVSGVNHFVPHAFSARTEDPDSPPHFYNGGRNPQYFGFKKLMEYMGRMCTVLRAGSSCAELAVYFNIESDCCGSECIELDSIAAVLGKAHIDYDFVPMDYLLEATESSGKLSVRDCVYKALIVPYGKVIPDALCQKLNLLSSKGVPVIYAGGKPLENEYGNKIKLHGEPVSLDILPEFVMRKDVNTMEFSKIFPNLRTLHLKEAQDDLYFFFNPDLYETVDTQIQFTDFPAITAYDAWHNCVYGIHGNGDWYPLVLQPGCSVLWCVRKKGVVLPKKVAQTWTSFLPEQVKVTLEEQGSTLFEKELSGKDAFKNYARMFPKFGGIIRYEFDCEKDIQAIKLGMVGEVSHLWVDGIDMGTEIDNPHIFTVSNFMPGVVHKIVVEVAVNQGYKYRDAVFSSHLPMKPMGVAGPIEIVEAKI